MGRGNQGHSGICPTCNSTSSQVLKYGTRELKHFTIGGDSLKFIPFIVFRCKNAACIRKSFTHYAESDRVELCGKSIYSKSTHDFVSNKMLKQTVSYHSFQQQIESDFNINTSISTLYAWSKKVKLVDASPDLSGISVLNTDEKHPKKK